MAGLRLYTSNRLEILVEELAALVGSPLADPFKSEFVVVQSKGMERWISMELARIHGVCANIRFPFPDHFVGLVFKAFFPDTSDGAAFDPAVMTWRIMRVLPSLVEKRVFRELRHYLSGDDTGVKLFQLSEKIAAVFDQYIVFRPEMVLGWQQGREDHWQAVLWRELVRGHETSHDAALRRSFLESVKKSDARPEGLPERVAVFGISHLPPYHVQIFSAVSKLIDVHLFLLNPCREYWGDIVSGREMRRISERSGKAGKMPEDLYLYGGNSLLASMGALGRDFIDMIYGLGCDERDFFLDPQDGTLLSSIQSDILNLRDRGRSGNEKGLIREDDLSIRIHSCHSPMREIEVLQDSLLAMFDADRTLRPVDVLVMAPDIGSYAPFIEAVFTLAVDDPRWIPFSIADRGVRRQSPVIQAFLDLLALYGGRFGALQVLSVLETRAVRDKFSINEEDFEIIQNWVRETGIRWGIDAESRKTLGLPEFPENTWRSGFERLLLGYALPGRGDNIYEGIAPYDALEGSETAVFNRFLAFADRLFKFVSGLGEPRTPDRWAVLLSEILDYFFLSDEETQRDMQVIRRALNGLAEVRSLAGFDDKIGIDVIRPYLEGRLEGDDYGAGFLSGGLTFCSILPMRSIPFRVICLIGMNDGDYPRETRSMGFDLISREPIPGDRSRRNDDRYLFLEAVLSAREKLHISYLGQSHQDNSVRPPSVLVSELLDYIEQGFET
ncbi:MAG: exodeoxyribonuclease V subunit gamma, partial [Syntrophales bacterium]